MLSTRSVQIVLSLYLLATSQPSHSQLDKKIVKRPWLHVYVVANNVLQWKFSLSLISICCSCFMWWGSLSSICICATDTIENPDHNPSQSKSQSWQQTRDQTGQWVGGEVWGFPPIQSKPSSTHRWLSSFLKTSRECRARFLKVKVLLKSPIKVNLQTPYFCAFCSS